MNTKTDNPGLQFLCDSEELAEDTLREFRISGPDGPVDLVVARLQGRARAWFNVCPHQGRAMNFAPDRFLRDDSGNLVCAAHGACFALPSGHCISGPCRGASLRALELQEHNGRVFAIVQDNRESPARC